MRRISQNRALFEAAPGEIITVIIEAIHTPYQVTFSDLKGGAGWLSIQEPTTATPVEERRFTMPAHVEEFFVIDYAFPPSNQRDSTARYKLTFIGAAGSTDGPNDVVPPAVGDEDDLPYKFRLPATNPTELIAQPRRRSPRAKNKRRN